MTITDLPDAIEQALRAGPESSLSLLRAQRPALRTMTQNNHIAVFQPSDPGKFSPALRAALAARMARLWRCDRLADDYEAASRQQAPTDTETAAGDPGWHPAQEGWLAAVLRHVDLVTRTPNRATAADIKALYAAGLNDRDIVTLTGLIAFANYQILVVAGLSTLKEV
jgi:uncharacterized protein YciW